MLRQASSRNRIRIALLLCLLPSGIFEPRAGFPQSLPAPPIEITRVDLFSLKGWNSTQVGVLGFRLGMSRKEISGTAQAASVSLDDKSGQACLREPTCNVYSAGKYYGVSLTFNAADVLEKITIEVYQQGASLGERSAWLMNRFQGKTRQLAITYSDNLRLGILGAADTYRVLNNSPNPRVRVRLKSSEDWQARNFHREHHYSRLGLILAVDVLDYSVTASDGGTVRKLAFEFVLPENGLQ